MWSLFLVFLKIGSVVFAAATCCSRFSGLTSVVHRGWVTDAQLVDAVAIDNYAGPGLYDGHIYRVPAARTCSARLSQRWEFFCQHFFWWRSAGPLIPLSGVCHAGCLLDGVNVASLAIKAAVSYQLDGRRLSIG